MEHYFDGLLSFADHMIEEGFVSRENGAMISVSSDPSALIDMLVAYTPPRTVEKWIDRTET